MNSEYKSGNSVAQIFVALVATVLIGSVAIVGTVGPATAAPAAIHTIAWSFLASICVPSKE